MAAKNRPMKPDSGFLFVSGGLFKRAPLFPESEAAKILLEMLEAYRERYAFRVHAYAVMPDHYHFLIWFPEEGDFRGFLRDFKSLAAKKILGWLKVYDSQLLRRFLLPGERRRQKDPRYCILQHGNYVKALRDGEAAVKVIEYIHMNPVRAGLASSADQYEFSSAGFFMRKAESIVKVEWIES
jgi:putative transposase